jgi:hypothetical protein
MTGPRIPAIETRAYGCKFRSRLEARWAIFMSEAGFTWTYEPEGLELPSGRYLPDFRVSANGITVWLEVKPPNNNVDDPRWSETAVATGQMIFTVRGMHRFRDRCGTDHSARVWHPDGTVADVDRLWQGEQYRKAWDLASSARFDGKDKLSRGPKRRRTE